MYLYLYSALFVEGYVGGGLSEAGNLGLNQRERAASLPGLPPVFSNCMLATSILKLYACHKYSQVVCLPPVFSLREHHSTEQSADSKHGSRRLLCTVHQLLLCTRAQCRGYCCAHMHTAPVIVVHTCTVQRLLLCTRATGSGPQSKTFTERQRGWRGVKPSLKVGR